MNSHAARLAFVITAACSLASPGFAATFSIIKKATNPKVNSLIQTLAPEWDKSRNCVDTLLVKVVEPTDAKGRAPAVLRQAMAAESIHRYVTSFFDEGISLSPVKGAKKVEEIFSQSNFNDMDSDGKLKMGFFKSGLTKAVADATLEIYSGSASGNNTMGDVVVVYDVKNGEIASFVESNFASDSNCGD